MESGNMAANDLFKCVFPLYQLNFHRVDELSVVYNMC